MLESADDDPRRYPLFGGEAADGFLAAVGVGGEEALPSRLGNQEVCCPFICLCFCLVPIVTVLVCINVYTFFAVQKDVCGFMEQTEPDLVV